ncbi:ABC transporter permease [Paenibacillus albidus]|uniref:ABC transporter permease n=1 Tax=Paenibacillus albidus TaxID=2041023 RepID=UPI001BE6DE35|nr:ABC transporter permease [Paenibacillus albidus]MBT2289114.1 ABC transporter permease [Paenibacillus albidus]
MLKLIQIEFLKLRRRKFVWIMMLSALIMPFLSFLLFKYAWKTGGDPTQFYKWSAFGFTLWVILPVVLGILSTMLMDNENQYDMLKQLWIVPVSKMNYFFSKFFVVLIYSVCFMIVTAIGSMIFSVFSESITFDWVNFLYLMKKCLESGVITAFVMLPILAIATTQKGYILPVSISLVYAFLGFIIMGINMYIHPLSSMAVIVARNGDIPGLIFAQAINLPMAFLCIFVWDSISVLLANIALGRRK